MKTLTLLILVAFSFQAAAARGSNFQREIIKGKKTGSDPNVQWTLADWLSEKNAMSLMDQWLAMHSSSKWFEFNVNATSQQFRLRTDSGSTTSTTDQNGQTYQADIYLSLLNLNGEYQKTNNGQESYGGAAGLRLLGTSSRSTNLVARYGWRRLETLATQERWDNQYAEASLQLYLVHDFGLTGQYRYYFPADSNRGTRLQGHKVTAGAFIDILIFRIYGDYYQEPMELSSAGVVTRQTSDGYDVGAKFFF